MVGILSNKRIYSVVGPANQGQSARSLISGLSFRLLSTRRDNCHFAKPCLGEHVAEVQFLLRIVSITPAGKTEQAFLSTFINVIQPLSEERTLSVTEE